MILYALLWIYRSIDYQSVMIFFFFHLENRIIRKKRGVDDSVDGVIDPVNRWHNVRNSIRAITIGNY